MGLCHEQFGDSVVVFVAAGVVPLRTTAQHAVFLEAHGLGPAGAGQRDHDRLVLDEIEVFEVEVVGVDFRAAFVAKLLANHQQFVADDLQQTFRTGQDVDEVGNGFEQGRIFGDDLVALQAR